MVMMGRRKAPQRAGWGPTMEQGALSVALLVALGLLALLGLIQGFVHRQARRAIMALRANRDQVTPESLRAHCEPLLEARLHAIRQAAPRVQAIAMKVDLLTYDGGWVPKSVPSPVLWLEPRYDRGPEDLEIDEAERRLVRDSGFSERLLGHVSAEQLTLASILGGHRLVVRVGAD